MKLRISKYWFAFLVFLILLLLLLSYRYLDLGYEIPFVITAALVWSGVIFLLFIAGLKYENPINPISAYSIFIILFGYSVIPMSNEQRIYSVTTYSIFYLSILSFLFPIFFNIKLSNIKVTLLSLKKRVRLLYFLLTSSSLVFVAECVVFGYIPIMEMFSKDIYQDTNDKLLPFLHYFIVLNSFIPCWAYLFYKQKVLTKTRFQFILVISLVILLNYLSRQVYLLLGVSFFLAFSQFYIVKLGTIVKVISLVLLLFLFFGFVKFHSPTTESFSEYTRLVAGISNTEVNVLESTLVEYSSKRYSALDQIVDTRANLEYYGMGIYSFRPLISFFLLEKIGVISRLPELDSETLVATYAADPFLDFGFWGVIFINFLYGAFSAGCYENYTKGKSVAVVQWGIVVFCCIMGMFVNYFNTMLIWLGLIINQILFYKLEEVK